MKKRFKLFSSMLLVAVFAATAFLLAACGDDNGGLAAPFNKEARIIPISREAGSGTRAAFDGNITSGAGVSFARWQAATTATIDGQPGLGNALPGIMNFSHSTSGMMTTVANSPNAIGYVGIANLNATVRAVTVDGAIADSAENPLFRPFVLVYNNEVTQNPILTDFINFTKSPEAQAIVSNVNQTPLPDGAIEDEPFVSAHTARPSGAPQVLARGSSSVAALMAALIAEYIRIVPWAVAGDFQLDMTSSGHALTWTTGTPGAGNHGNVIGAHSAAASLNFPETNPVNVFTVAYDRVAVIVHPTNPLTNVTL
ncbi:MAG: hypothetical protein FWB72_01245, partial [Firmicutes bacterium]|nr:hypothetical protein [Bacillota bacterium]